MAEIFRARPVDAPPDSEPIVLKRVLPHLAVEPSFIKMFTNEATFCTRLYHPNIIRTFEFGQAEDNHYLTMEYVAGQDLLDEIRTRFPGAGLGLLLSNTSSPNTRGFEIRSQTNVMQS